MNEPKKIQRVPQARFDHLVKTQPTHIVGELIDQPTLVYQNDVPTLGYFFVPPALLRDIRRVARATKPRKSFRTQGLPTQSTVYGVMPRNPIRANYCRFTVATKQETELYKVMNHYCEILCEVYQKYFPENYKAALQELRSAVHSDWRHNQTPFQTININVNHAIKYHRDTGNFKQAMSTVLIVKEEISGGELPVPEYDLTLSQRDGAFTVFDGQSLLHGVLPICQTAPRGYRASIVFYSMSGLTNCYPYQEELQRIALIERDKASQRYSLESKKKLIRQSRSALQRINSPLLKLLDEDPPPKPGKVKP